MTKIRSSPLLNLGFYVFLGGCAGTAARLVLTTYIPHNWYPIVIGNLLGSMILGGLAAYSLVAHPYKKNSILYALWGTGFCGGLTSMSSFVLQLHLSPANIASQLMLVVISTVVSFVVSYTVGVYTTRYCARNNHQLRARAFPRDGDLS